MSVHKPKNLIEQMQNAEYILGIALRHILAAVNGIHVTPGPFSLYRRSLVDTLGGFRKGHNTEDMEMALRIQRAGFAIDSAPRAQVFTKTPGSIGALVKQRIRWTTGFLRNVLNEYRDLIGNPRYGALGVIVLPLGFFAIAGGILMTGVIAYTLGENLVKAYLTVSGVPLSYTLAAMVPSAASFGWFYVPLTLFLLLAIIAAVGSILFILVGRNISGTKGSLSVGIVGYLLAYGLIAPFWLVRSVADVASGTLRSWR
jgi:cellulose synthase/poly-beta-1,6-N-acetylglucosamine synthase-like glycosyltransferase